MSLKKVLEYIYNGAYNELLEPNQDVFRNKSEIEEVMKKYSKWSASKCKLCKIYDPKHQEFPGWIGPLEYNERGKIENKDIIIFGLEPGPKSSVEKVLKTKYIFPKKYNIDFSFIHIWYELGFDTSVDDLINNSKYGNRLFEYLSIFLYPLSHYIERIYGTDLAKCFTDNKNESRKICSKEFLPRELGCFENNQMVFILQGRESKPILEQFFKFKADEAFCSFLEQNKDQIGKLGVTYNKTIKEYSFEIGSFTPCETKKINLSGKYLLIPHSSGQTVQNWNKMLYYHDNLGNDDLEATELYENFKLKIRKFLF